MNRLVVKRLEQGDWSFGHGGLHDGVGTEECPPAAHHHDEFCQAPSIAELLEAGIDPAVFRPRSRRRDA